MAPNLLDKICAHRLTASDTGKGILTDARIEDGIRDLIAELIRVTLVHGLRREEESIRHFSG
jgi:3'-phosphoadenosine 5'-phosphosulfate sulfotransferase (PAPS reductase)/FAD synthetase